ncbi:DUF7351 domain-containing protein [Halospeciosus flavus]|uniref:Helix-turn-helix domain-containing protein n=1 Tax=Halospeciosus flavus TaxID=3032283 RepID=A0ABD5Z7P3_9EURY|nr:helix-turn-helix domain-containing protein [Halospeciosus flavus]
MTAAVHVERAPPEDVFSLLGNELRVDILEALAETPDEPVSFSTLRERVGEHDSGKFNYHLGKLVGQFVRHTDDGYELTLAGAQLVGALFSGTYTADAELDPVEVDDPCPSCGESPLVAEYEDEYAHTYCPSCGEWENRFSFPPGALDQYDVDDLPATFDRWMRSTFQRVVSGFCPVCAGRMDGELFAPDDRDEPARARFECARCGDAAYASAGTPLLFHPGMLGFYYDHGVDATATPTWRVTAAQDDYSVDLVTEDPLRVRVEVEVDGDTATAVVDENATVASFERSDR